MKFFDNPDDQAARVTLAQQLTLARLNLGVTQIAVAQAAGMPNGRVSLLERKPDGPYRIRFYTRIANALGLHLTLVPVGRVYARVALKLPLSDRDRFWQFAVMQQAVDARHAMVRVGAVAERMGLTIPAVYKIEQLDVNDPALDVWQAYVRGVGGRLEAILEPFDGRAVKA